MSTSKAAFLRFSESVTPTLIWEAANFPGGLAKPTGVGIMPSSDSKCPFI